MRILPFALLLPLIAPSLAGAESPLFLVDAPYDPPQLTTIYTVDPGTGAMTVVAQLDVTYTPVFALAAADGRTLYASGSDNTGTICSGAIEGCLLLKVVIDPASPTPSSVEVVGPFLAGEQPVTGVVGMTFRGDGVLYMDSQDDDGLYTVDHQTGQASLIGIPGVTLHGGDLTFDADDRLLLWTNDFLIAAGLYELEPSTGAATLVDLEPGSNYTGLAALGHSDVLYASNVYTDRLHSVDPLTGFTGVSVPLTLDGAQFNHKRGDLDSPFCADDAACDDLNPCTVDRCTPGGCRHLLDDATCDGVDDDCDGLFDEDYVPQQTGCGVGPCASTGATACVNGGVEDSCMAGVPGASDSSCNGIDDDCDGLVDEEGDPDGDGVSSCFDNCPSVANAGQDDSDGDSAGDACDCAPGDARNGPPAEVASPLELLHAGGSTTIAWDQGAITGPFRVYRGFRGPASGWSYNQTCIAPELTDRVAQDALLPPPGRVFYYVVSRVGCGESVLARDSTGAPIPNDDPCPSTGHDADGDGIEEAVDNCPGIANPTQDDADADGIGDACE